MKKIIMLLLFMSTITLSGCVDYFNCISGSKNVISEERILDSSFDSIKIEGSAEVYYTQGAQTPLIIETDDNVISEIETIVSGNTLIIKNKKCFRSYTPVKIIVGSEEIKDLEISGSGKIESMNEISTDSLDILISGSGDINLKGNSNNLKTTITGSGNILTSSLKTKTSELKIYGSGTAKLNVQEELDIYITGSGKVYYLGNPKLTQSISGSGKIEQIEDKQIDVIECKPEQRAVDGCIEIYQPVCGTVNVQCVKEPCDPVEETFENSCKACVNPLVSSYIKGECSK